MINLVVKSGLGNQLFQYAFARALQEEYKKRGIFEELKINPFYVNNTFVIIWIHLCIHKIKQRLKRKVFY